MWGYLVVHFIHSTGLFTSLHFRPAVSGGAFSSVSQMRDVSEFRQEEPTITPGLAIERRPQSELLGIRTGVVCATGGQPFWLRCVCIFMYNVIQNCSVPLV